MQVAGSDHPQAKAFCPPPLLPSGIPDTRQRKERKGTHHKLCILGSLAVFLSTKILGRGASAYLSGQRALERPPRAPVESPPSLLASGKGESPTTSTYEMQGFHILFRNAREGSGDKH